MRTFENTPWRAWRPCRRVVRYAACASERDDRRRKLAGFAGLPGGRDATTLAGHQPACLAGCLPVRWGDSAGDRWMPMWIGCACGCGAVRCRSGWLGRIARCPLHTRRKQGRFSTANKRAVATGRAGHGACVHPAIQPSIIEPSCPVPHLPSTTLVWVSSETPGAAQRSASHRIVQEDKTGY